MGRHSIRGVLTGEELNVCGTGSFKRKGRHHIGGGEYATVVEWLPAEGYGPIPVDITYSIAPQGPGKGVYVDKAHPRPTGWQPCIPIPEWRRHVPMAKGDTVFDDVYRQAVTMTPNLENVVTLAGRRKINER